MNTIRFRELIRAGVPDPFPHPEGGGKGGTPPAPDYTGAAREQSAASKEIATQQTFANRPTLNTPWGQMQWGQAAGQDPATGQAVTNWTGNLSLSPDQQAALDAQQNITAGRSQAAETLLGQATGAFQTPMNWSNLPARAGNVDQTTQTTNEPGFAGERQRIEQALFDKMRPEHARQEDTARTRLANTGLPTGGEAYNRELERLHGVQAGERFNAMQSAGQEQQRMQAMLLGQQQQAFGQDLSGSNFQNTNRQQAIAEEAQRRGMPLNELNALLTGQQVQTPQMPSFLGATAGQAPNLLGAAQMQGDYGLKQAEMKAAGAPDIGSLIGTGATIAMMTSDARLKSRIRRIGTHARGIGIYRYVIFGREEIGVLAQELQQIAPELVITTPSGYLAVNYGGL